MSGLEQPCLRGALLGLEIGTSQGTLSIGAGRFGRAPRIVLSGAFLALRAPDCNGWPRDGLRDNGAIGTQEEPAVFRRNTPSLKWLAAARGCGKVRHSSWIGNRWRGQMWPLEDSRAIPSQSATWSIRRIIQCGISRLIRCFLSCGREMLTCCRHGQGVGRVTPCAPRMPQTNRIRAVCAGSAARTE